MNMCPAMLERCPENCQGPISAELKFQGKRVTDKEVCLFEYLRAKTLPGVHVEVLTNGVVIDSDGLAIDTVL